MSESPVHRPNDHYYEKEPMTPLDKALFAFASYNTGAGRITSLRKEAAKRGLDPNVWFQNVEYVVDGRRPSTRRPAKKGVGRWPSAQPLSS